MAFEYEKKHLYEALGLAEPAFAPEVASSLQEAKEAIHKVLDAMDRYEEALLIEEARGIVEAGPEVWAQTARERFGREPSRLFPKTYGDWVDLALDIKDRDPTLANEVNDALSKIYEEIPDSEEAKRWLVTKAGELGIR